MFDKTQYLFPWVSTSVVWILSQFFLWIDYIRFLKSLDTTFYDSVIQSPVPADLEYTHYSTHSNDVSLHLLNCVSATFKITKFPWLLSLLVSMVTITIEHYILDISCCTRFPNALATKFWVSIYLSIHIAKHF